MHLAVDYPAWGGFVLRTGTRRGRLVDIYLPRDLALAKERGQADFPTVRAAQDVAAGLVDAGTGEHPGRPRAEGACA